MFYFFSIRKFRNFYILIKIIFKSEQDAKSLKKIGYDTIIIATGTNQMKPPIKGIDNNYVFNALDILNKPELIKDAKDVVVIGGGFVGTELAYMLKYELQKEVKVVEMMKYFMNGTCTANRGHIIHYLERAGVELLNCSKVNEIADNKVMVSQNTHKNVPNPYNTWAPILPDNVENPLDKLKKIKDKYADRQLKADAVIYATGVKSNNDIYYQCLKNRSADEIFNIGDSFKGGKVFEAVRSAYRKAINI